MAVFAITCDASGPYSPAREFSSAAARRRCCRLVVALMNRALAFAVAFALARALALAIVVAFVVAFASASAGGMARASGALQKHNLSQQATHTQSGKHLMQLP